MDIISTHDTGNSATIKIVHADGEMYVPDDMSNRHRQEIAEWESIEGNDRQPYVADPTYPTQDAAVQALIVWVDEFTAKVTGPVPKDEKHAWGPKEPAAKAFLAGTADAEQMELLQDEAEITGETLTELSSAIVTKAQGFRKVVSKVSGLRRMILKEIEAESDPHRYETILLAGQAQAVSMASELGLSVA